MIINLINYIYTYIDYYLTMSNEANTQLEELETKNQRLEWNNAELRYRVNKLADDVSYYRRCNRNLNQYREMYNDLRSRALGEWEPDLFIARQLKKTNPKLYQELMKIFLKSEQAKKADDLMKNSFVFL